MTGPHIEQPIPEQQPRHELALTTGVARLLAGKPYYNPAQMFTQQDVDALQRKLQTTERLSIDFSSIAAVSLQQRRDAPAPLGTWVDAMANFVQGLTGNEFAKLREILDTRFGIFTTQSKNDIIRSLKPFWERYHKDGSQIELFLSDLYGGIRRDDIAEFQHRSKAVEPLLSVFGGEETKILIRDSAIAYLLSLSDYKKNDAARILAQAITKPFSSDTEKHAYALLWEQVKEDVEEEKRRHPQPRPAPAPQEQPPAQQQIPHEPPQQAPPRVRGRETIPPISALVLSPSVVQHEKSFSTKGAGEAATLSVKSPEHPTFSADRALVGSFGAQEGFFLAAIRGGSKTESGGDVATTIQQSLQQELSRLPQVPTIEEGVRHIVAGLSTALPYIESIRRKHPGQNILPTTAVGLVCKNENGQSVLVSLNIGNNIILKISPTTKTVTPLTTEHTTPGEFGSSERQQITRTLSLEHVTNLVDDLDEILRRGWDNVESDTISVTPLEKNTLYLALTSGVLSHIPPEFLSQELFDVWNASTTRGTMHVAEFNKKLAALIREKMLHPDLYMYHSRIYPHADDLGIASLYLGK